MYSILQHGSATKPRRGRLAPHSDRFPYPKPCRGPGPVQCKWGKVCVWGDSIKHNLRGRNGPLPSNLGSSSLRGRITQTGGYGKHIDRLPPDS